MHDNVLQWSELWSLNHEAQAELNISVRRPCFMHATHMTAKINITKNNWEERKLGIDSGKEEKVRKMCAAESK